MIEPHHCFWPCCPELRPDCYLMVAGMSLLYMNTNNTYTRAFWLGANS